MSVTGGAAGRSTIVYTATANPITVPARTCSSHRAWRKGACTAAQCNRLGSQSAIAGKNATSRITIMWLKKNGIVSMIARS